MPTRDFLFGVCGLAAQGGAGAEPGIGEDEQGADRDEVQQAVGRRRGGGGKGGLRRGARGGDEGCGGRGKSERGDDQSGADDDEQQDGDEGAVMSDSGGVDGEGDPDRRQAADQMAGPGQQRRAEHRIDRHHRLAEECAERIAQHAHAGGPGHPIDECDEEAGRHAQAAGNPHVLRSGARHHGREHGEQVGLRQHRDAGHEHGQRHQPVHGRVDREALHRDEVDAGPVFGRDGGSRDGQDAQCLGEAIVGCVAFAHDAPAGRL